MYNDIILYHSGHYSESCICSFCINRRNIKRALESLGYCVMMDALRCDWDYFYPSKIHFDFALGYQNKVFGEFMFEADRMPLKVVEFAERHFDYIICGSKFLKDTWIRSGVHSNYLIPFDLGIDTSIFTPRKPKNLLYPGVFKFTSVGAWQNEEWQDRKGFIGLIKLFKKVFEDRKDVMLLIKSNMHADMICSKGNVSIINKDIDTEELVNLYRSCAVEGAYVHPHKGEGFGRTLLEALCCGCSIGATDYSGPLNFLNSNNATLFRYKLINSNIYNFAHYKDGVLPRFAEVNESDLTKWMLKSVRGMKKNPQVNLEKYSWSTVVRGLMKSIERRI